MSFLAKNRISSRVAISYAPPLVWLNIQCLRQHTFDDFPVHIREAVLPALVAEGEFLVVDAEEVQERRLVIVDVDRILGDVPSEVVGLAKDVPRFDAAARHPEGEGPAEVIAAVRFLR